MKLLLPLSILAFPSVASSEISYACRFDPPSKSVFVKIEAAFPAGDAKVVLPSWCPGFYTLKNYGSKVFDVKAVVDRTRAIHVAKSGQAFTFNLQEPGTVAFSYRVLGDDPGLGFFGANVRDEMGFINGPSTFMYLDGRKGEPIRLTIEAPNGWPVKTAMDRKGSEFVVSGYDELIDHPIQVGRMTTKTFKVGDAEFEIVAASQSGLKPELAALADKLAKESKAAIDVFGGTPFKRYIYLLHLGIGDFSGGLEHRASTTMAVEDSESIELGTLAIHEFFHVWNVKHIRPEALGPFDYTAKVRTKHLWWSEGVTDYYANLLANRAQTINEAELLTELASQIATLQMSRTRLSMTLESACWNTWESGGFSFGDLDYYNKGLVVGLLLDAAIIDATDGKKSLDDVMRLLFTRHRLPKPGFKDDGIRDAIDEVAGASLGSLYDRFVRSTMELDYSLLQRIGLLVELQNGSIKLRRLPVRDERSDRLFAFWAGNRAGNRPSS